jgi:hypothetical protein
MSNSRQTPGKVIGLVVAAVLVLAALAIVRGQAGKDPAPAPAPGSSETPGPGSSGKPSVRASSREEAGKYLLGVGGCNDCHTDEFMVLGEKIPEAERFLGSAMGWRGPWGTTYAANLRLSVQDFDEKLWVRTMHERSARPPMPWHAIKAMSEEDLGAVYAYLKSMGPKGKKMPAALPPGEEPETAYFNLEPVLPKGETELTPAK